MGNGERLTETMCVSLADVRIGQRRRRSVNASKVEQYRRWLEQGRQAPPVRLARDGAGYVVRDGRHRVVAAVAAGHADIDAVVSAIASLILALTRRGCASSWASDSSGGGHSPPLEHRTTTWGCLVGRAPRLQRGRAGSTPAVSTLAWGRSTRKESVPLGFLVVADAKPDSAAGGRGFESLRLHSSKPP
jgi:hypothetical protein